jgi:hypothetical protein
MCKSTLFILQVKLDDITTSEEKGEESQLMLKTIVVLALVCHARCARMELAGDLGEGLSIL